MLALTEFRKHNDSVAHGLQAIMFSLAFEYNLRAFPPQNLCNSWMYVFTYEFDKLYMVFYLINSYAIAINSSYSHVTLYWNILLWMVTDTHKFSLFESFYDFSRKELQRNCKCDSLESHDLLCFNTVDRWHTSSRALTQRPLTYIYHVSQASSLMCSVNQELLRFS